MSRDAIGCPTFVVLPGLPLVEENMAFNRRSFLVAAGGAAAFRAARLASGAPAGAETWIPDYERPVFDLHFGTAS